METPVLSEEEIRNITVNSIRRIKLHMAEEEEKAREAEKKNGIYVPAEAPMFFAIRIRCAYKAPPDVAKALKMLRLTRLNTGAFVVNNKSCKSLLHKVKSYITYGTLSLEAIRELLYKKGLCRHNGNKSNITQEILFERFGGEVRTIEEIVEAFYLGKKNASAINKFLWPFHMNSPKMGFGGRKIKDFAEGGSTGYRGKYMSELVTRMI